MKIDQIIVSIYVLLGILLGLASNYFNKNLGGLLLAFVVPLAIYLATLFPLLKLVKQKQKKWLIQNSLIAFFLIWIIVWIIAHNVM
jgi:hypothetical protein